MNGKKKKKISSSILKKKLEKFLKTELRAVYVTTSNKSFLHLNDAIDCESIAQNKKEQVKRKREEIMNIHELLSKILSRNHWGIFFKEEPMVGYPTQDGVKIYKVNEITADRLYDAIDNELKQMENECQESSEDKQIDGESLNG